MDPLTFVLLALFVMSLLVALPAFAEGYRFSRGRSAGRPRAPGLRSFHLRRKL
jgi:hypothetical protein